MNAISEVVAVDYQWFAVKLKPKRGSVHIGAQYETFRKRSGIKAKRRVEGTGQRMMVSEVLLRRAGFEVFIPVRKVWRRANRFLPEKRLVTYPLLVDWIFVGWPVGQFSWFDLMRLDVVAGVMGTGGRPVKPSNDRVIRLMRQWGDDAMTPAEHRFMRAHAEFSVGDTARIVEGPLDGAEVRVVEINGPSVKAVLAALGGDIRVEIGADVLEVVR